MEKRFFIEKMDIVGGKITLKDSEHEHLFKVLRLRVGDMVECFYDGGPILNCEIESITKNFSILTINSESSCESNPKSNVTLFQALPKLDKLELVTQKATELGISALVPFSSAFCIAKQNENKIDRLKKIVVSACKQCGRTKLLEIKSHLTFENLIKSLSEFDIVVFANEKEENGGNLQDYNEDKQNNKNRQNDGKAKNEEQNKENNGQNIKKIFEQNKIDKKVAIIVGSEGGFSDNEIESLLKLENVLSISLGKRILRTETASITLCSIIQFLLGEI